MRYVLAVLILSVAAFATDTCVILAPPRAAVVTPFWHHSLVYVAGEYPRGFHFRSEVKDKDVDKIKAKGGQVVVLHGEYTPEELDAAKNQCEAKKAEK